MYRLFIQIEVYQISCTLDARCQWKLKMVVNPFKDRLCFLVRYLLNYSRINCFKIGATSNIALNWTKSHLWALIFPICMVTSIQSTAIFRQRWLTCLKFVRLIFSSFFCYDNDFYQKRHFISTGLCSHLIRYKSTPPFKKD